MENFGNLTLEGKGQSCPNFQLQYQLTKTDSIVYLFVTSIEYCIGQSRMVYDSLVQSFRFQPARSELKKRLGYQWLMCLGIASCQHIIFWVGFCLQNQISTNINTWRRRGQIGRVKTYGTILGTIQVQEIKLEPQTRELRAFKQTTGGKLKIWIKTSLEYGTSDQCKGPVERLDEFGQIIGLCFGAWVR